MSTPETRLKVCLASSELAPLAKTGGLADVSAALSAYLHDSGHDMRVLLPRYRQVESLGLDIEPVPGMANIGMRLGHDEIHYGIDRTVLPGTTLPVYLLRCPALFDRDTIYTDDHDEYLRFVLLSRAAIDMCQRMGFAPDIFSCHDWQTALIPLYLKTVFSWDQLFARTRTVLTIHNIGYQGMFPSWILDRLELGDAGHHLHQDDLKDGVINFLKTGVMYADAITTVSPTYAREILGDDFGMGLNHLLRDRAGSLFGILNGVDYAEWNPATDPLIPVNYSPEDMRGKHTCKRRLMEETGLDVDAGRPLVGIVSRLVGQKGIELVEQVLPAMLEQRDFAIAVLGSGERRYEDFFNWLKDRFPGRASYYQGFSNELAHWIEAGADMFLMPSLYEPCGLNQMYSLKYGTVPIVRETGGLADSVQQADPSTGRGTGILFRDYNAEGLYWALDRALELYGNPALWQTIVANGMRQDFSWDTQGARYVELFEALRQTA